MSLILDSATLSQDLHLHFGTELAYFLKIESPPVNLDGILWEQMSTGNCLVHGGLLVFEDYNYLVQR